MRGGDFWSWAIVGVFLSLSCELNVGYLSGVSVSVGKGIRDYVLSARNFVYILQ